MIRWALSNKRVVGDGAEPGELSEIVTVAPRLKPDVIDLEIGTFVP
jgi:hypothetical protein